MTEKRRDSAIQQNVDKIVAEMAARQTTLQEKQNSNDEIVEMAKKGMIIETPQQIIDRLLKENK